MDPIRKIPKKFTKKFVNKVINRQYFLRKTRLEARKVLLSSTITQRTKCKCIVQAMPTIKWPDYVKEEDITLENP